MSAATPTKIAMKLVGTVSDGDGAGGVDGSGGEGAGGNGGGEGDGGEDDSNGALELPNGASALTPFAWLLWMLQVVNVTVPPSIRTPPPCKPRRVLAFGQFRERASIGALEGAGAVEQSGGTYSLRRRESRRGTSSDVSSTIPMGHWNGAFVQTAERHVHTARRASKTVTRRETSSHVS